MKQFYNFNKLFVYSAEKIFNDCFFFVFFRITKYLGYEPDSLISKSMFDYYHAQDYNSVEKSFKICKCF